MQEIEDVLNQYPEHPYQAVFSMPELRQKLIDHVHCYVSPHHDAGGRQNTIPGNSIAHRASFLQERLRLGMLIRGSMLHLLRQEDAEQVDAPNRPWHRP
ncbi:MAG: hypothetical protein KME14_02025 [Tildeniella torsiva UHER 1998/13D]|jgi:hypothetical protein|nr:hypothetical protein [Tildeniella torsiva UHER 1998/13D]